MTTHFVVFWQANQFRACLFELKCNAEGNVAEQGRQGERPLKQPRIKLLFQCKFSPRAGSGLWVTAGMSLFVALNFITEMF